MRKTLEPATFVVSLVLYYNFFNKKKNWRRLLASIHAINVFFNVFWCSISWIWLRRRKKTHNRTHEWKDDDLKKKNKIKSNDESTSKTSKNHTYNEYDYYSLDVSLTNTFCFENYIWLLCKLIGLFIRPKHISKDSLFSLRITH